MNTKSALKGGTYEQHELTTRRHKKHIDSKEASKNNWSTQQKDVETCICTQQKEKEVHNKEMMKKTRTHYEIKVY